MLIPCVGGHHDGEFWEFRGCEYLQLAIPEELEFLVPDDTLMLEMPKIKVEHYHLHRIYTHGVIAQFWKHESLSAEEGIAKLIDGYRTPAKKEQYA